MEENNTLTVQETVEFLQVPTPKITNGIIECDFTQLKSQVKAKVEEYKAMTLTESNYRDLADYKARINHTIDDLKKHRTLVKKTFLKPFEKYDSNINEILGVLAEAKDSLETQVDIFNTKLEDDKKREILDYFNKLCEDKNFHMIDLSKIWNKRWLNKTFKAEDIKKDINNCLLLINNGVETLANYDDYRMLIQEFLDRITYENLNNNSLINEIIIDYTSRKKRAEELRLQEEKEKVEPVVESIVEPKPIVAPKVETVKDTTGELVSFNLTIRNINKEKALALNNFLKTSGINYELKVIK